MKGRDIFMHIESNRLILRNWEEADVDALVDGLNNINVSKWLANIPFPYTKKDAIDYINMVKDDDGVKKNAFAIVLKETGEVIGGTEYREVNKKDGTASGGIWLNEKFQKNGYGSEAFSIRNKYCFEVLGLRRMENGYFPNNEKSRKMQLKLGYKDEGIKRQRFVSKATGKIEDEYITGLLKDEWIK